MKKALNLEQVSSQIERDQTSSVFETVPTANKFRGFVLLSIIILFCSLVPSVPLLAQSTGQATISGVVTDSDGALIPMATVIVKNTATGVAVTRRTNGAGYYEVDSLNPGLYSVSVSSPHFGTLVHQDITLEASAHIDISSTLSAGAISETVTIVTDSPTLTLDSGLFGETFNSETMQAVPVNGDDPLQFAQLAAGVQTPNAQNVYTTATYNNPASVSNFGAFGRINANSFSLDGTPNQGFARATAYVASADEISNMSVSVGGYEASAGHGYGVFLTQTTKSGTNQLHGSFGDHYSTRKWAALQHFQRLTYLNQVTIDGCSAHPGSPTCQYDQRTFGWPTATENRMGGTLGGPIFIPKVFDGHNKLFFFVGVVDDPYTDAKSQVATVPTVQERSGDFSDLHDPNKPAASAAFIAACGAGTEYRGQYQIYNPYGNTVTNGIPNRVPFCNNIIPPNLISTMPITSIVNNLWPTPTNGNTTGNNYNYVQVIPQTYVSATSRIDWAPSEKNHYFVRFNEMHYTYKGSGFTVGNVDELDTPRHLYQGGLGWSHVFNNSTFLDVSAGISDFRASYAYYPNYDKFKPSALGLPSYLDAQAGKYAEFPVLNFAGYSQIGNTDQSIPVYIRNTGLNANLIRVQGNHSIRGGVEFLNQNASGNGPGNRSGTFAFDATYTQQDNGSNINYNPSVYGLSYAAFLLGVQSTSSVTEQVSYSRHTPYYAAFVGDTWRANRNLTLIAGVRYEFEYGPAEKHDAQIVGWDPSAPSPIAAAANSAYQATRAAASTAAQAVLPASLNIQGGPIYAGVNGASRKQWINSYRILPRLAVAYQFNNRTVLRAGYGLFFDTLNADGEANAINQDGFTANTLEQSSTTYGANFSQSAVPLSDPFPIPASNGPRFNSPVGSSLGSSYYLGTSVGINDHNRVPARSHRITVSLQRAFSDTSVIELSWSRSFTTHITLDQGADGSSTGAVGAQNENAVPASLYGGGTVPNAIQLSLLSPLLPNPFQLANFSSLAISDPALYSKLSRTSYFQSPTITAAQLVVPHPELQGLNIYKSIGESKFGSFQAVFRKRLGKSLTLNATVQVNDQKDRDYFANAYETLPDWESSNLSRPYRVTGAGAYDLPLGKGKRFASHGWEAKIFRGFRLAGAYELQPGGLLTFANTFFIGNPQTIILKHPGYYGYKDSPTGKPYIQAFNTTSTNTTLTSGNCVTTGTGFIINPQCQPLGTNLRVFPTHVEGLRAAGPNAVQASLQRSFLIHGKYDLQPRIECFNIFNHQIVGGANTQPTNPLFGQVTSDGNGIGRNIQIQAYLRF